MSPELRAQIAALGAELSPAMLGGTSQLMAQIAAPSDPEVTVVRDRFYGPEERNRLDIFTRGTPRTAPVLVYIHGGGFVMGDKTSPGSPFYDNVGQWAAQQGFVGVTMTYRLAPAAQWPSGPEDLAYAVSWLRDHVTDYGGDPDAVFLLGQSAGAAHVAAYVSHPEHYPAGGAGIAGALMISCIFDPVAQPANPFAAAYYGDDPATLVEARCTAGLIASPVPMLFSVSEFDARDFQDQAATLVADWHRARGSYPAMEFLHGHNHLTPAQAIGSSADDLGPRVAAFIRSCCG
jgi:arylformamidase